MCSFFFHLNCEIVAGVVKLKQLYVGYETLFTLKDLLVLHYYMGQERDKRSGEDVTVFVKGTVEH